jgi:hypothetical protein
MALNPFPQRAPLRHRRGPKPGPIPQRPNKLDDHLAKPSTDRVQEHLVKPGHRNRHTVDGWQPIQPKQISQSTRCSSLNAPNRSRLTGRPEDNL